MANFTLKKGYDIPLDGAPAADVVQVAAPTSVAIKPIEYRGIKPKLLVAEGDAVKAGSPLCCVKNRDDILFTSPVSGTVSNIEHGARRVLNSITVTPDGKNEAVAFKQYDAGAISGLSHDNVLTQVLAAGMLPVFRQRPFANMADPDVTPRDIFISAFDTAPLAADTALIVKGNEAAFQAGLSAAAKLTTGKVHLSINGSGDVPAAFSGARDVEIHSFSGPHPAGCVGVQIHHIAPIKHRTDVVWYATVQGIILLGRLFLQGKYSPEIVVAIAGSAVRKPKHCRTIVGADVASILGEDADTGELRYISGNVLTGTKIAPDGHQNFYESTLTLIWEAKEAELLGWAMPGLNRMSKYRTYLSALIPGKKFAPDTKLNGGHRAFVATGYYEDVLPMDIFPMFLLKSILVEDFDEMEGLGIFEVTEEEFALCEYVCPSKMEIQEIIRDGLDLIQREG
jgi:Na+-transporting NADH:ubiquinone oxidoreductase subunit A